MAEFFCCYSEHIKLMIQVYFLGSKHYTTFKNSTTYQHVFKALSKLITWYGIFEFFKRIIQVLERTSSTHPFRFSGFPTIIKFATIGVSLILIASLILFCDPMTMLVDKQLSLTTGTLLYNFWENPPLEVLITVYVFNVTNIEAYINGTDSKLKVIEVGPYVYQEILENKNIQFNANNTVTYSPKRKVKFIREKSIGDPKLDNIVAPNIPYMGVTSDATSFSFLAAIAMRALTQRLNSKAMLHLSVHEYLWGYEDPLVQLASKLIPSIVNFQRFGLMERMFSEGNNTVTMQLPNKSKNKTIRDYAIDNWNGQTGMSFWNYHEGKNNTNCNTLRGAYEGTLFPRRIAQGENFRIYRKAFCRTLPLVYTHPTQYNGIEGYNFQVKDNAFDSDINDPDSSCFCKKHMCLKKGLGSIRPCYFNMPLAVSFPHFLHADRTLIAGIDGMEPNEAKHGSEVLIQPQLGIPMKVHTRFQVNLLMGDVKFNTEVAKFRHTVMPILWLEIGVDNLTPELLFLLQLLFKIGPLIQWTLVSALIVMGAALLMLVILFSFATTMRVPNGCTNVLPLFGHQQQLVPGAEVAAKLLPSKRNFTTKCRSDGHCGTATALLPSSLFLAAEKQLRPRAVVQC